MDVTRQDSIEAGFALAVAQMGRLDILINNAALFTAQPIVEITRADYDRIFSVNVAGTLFCLQAAARQMIAWTGRQLNAKAPAMADGRKPFVVISGRLMQRSVNGPLRAYYDNENVHGTTAKRNVAAPPASSDGASGTTAAGPSSSSSPTPTPADSSSQPAHQTKNE